MKGQREDTNQYDKAKKVSFYFTSKKQKKKQQLLYTYETEFEC